MAAGNRRGRKKPTTHETVQGILLSRFAFGSTTTQRWLKIIWKMWQTGTANNAALHMQNQLAHGSWVLQIQSK